MQKILNIHFKDYFWGKFEDLHERYYLKKITISNIIELFTRLQESMSNFSKELNTLITKDYILFPEQRSSKYDALEFIKLILTIQSTQLNVGVEVIKSRILETIKIQKEEEILEKELFNNLKKNINKYEEAKLNLNKAKEKFYQSTKIAEISIRQAKEFALKEKNKENNGTFIMNNNIDNSSNKSNKLNNNLNNENNEMLIKLEQKSLDNLIEARKNDEKYLEMLKEANNYREIVNTKQRDLLKFYENMENKDHQLYILLLKDYYSFLKTDNSIMKGNLIQMEDKINKIDFNKDIIELINIYGSEKRPEKIIKYRPYELEFNSDNSLDENDLTINYQITIAMKPFIKDLCPNFDIELETKKQEMRDLSQKIINKNGNIYLTDEVKKIILNFIKEDWAQKYFLSFLSKIRTTGKFRYEEEVIKYLSEIFKIILFSAKKNRDYESIKNCLILSQTYYYEDKKSFGKIYIVELINDNEWLKNPDFWKEIIDVMIKEDIEKNQKLFENNEKLNSKAQEESMNNIVFGQLVSSIKNMKDFKIHNNKIIKIVDEFVEKYKVGKNFSKNIYDNIGNEKEIEKMRKEYKNLDKNNDN